ncbi:MAG: hypothetical protein SGARI_005257, partial [Bacillariaceae sp.]
MDLNAATLMMDAVLKERKVKPSIGAYMIFFEMLKVSDQRTEALDFFHKLNDARILSRDAEDKLLMSICRWPKTTRQGNFVNLSSFLLDILSMVKEMVAYGQKPGLSVWMSLINNMNVTAQKDPSLWNHIASAMKAVLDLHPQYNFGGKLAIIGLNASIAGEDASLAAVILQRMAQKNRRNPPLHQSDGRIDNMDPPSSIPFAVVKSAMELCLQQSDAASAEIIFSSIKGLEAYYRDGILHELESLENLYGAVLHSLVLHNRQDEAEALVHSMESGDDGMDVTPGTSCYDALLVGRVRSHDWEAAIGIYDTMKERGVSMGPQTIQGLVLAHQQIGGKEAVVSAMEEILRNDKGAKIRNGVFQLIAQLLFENMDLRSFDTFRQQVRA